MTRRANQLHRREARRTQAEGRNTAWAALDPHQQVQHLEQRGHGHCKQAKKLRAKTPTETA